MINKAMLLGRVGRIETRDLPNGGIVTNLSMVTSKKYTKDGEKVEKSIWHNISLFSKLAEIAQKYVQVGDLFYVEGEIETNKFVDNNGVEKTRSFINGHEIKLMPKHNHQSKDQSKQEISNELDDEVPF